MREEYHASLGSEGFIEKEFVLEGRDEGINSEISGGQGGGGNSIRDVVKPGNCKRPRRKPAERHWQGRTTVGLKWAVERIFLSSVVEA